MKETIDDHPKLEEARVTALDNGIELAISNPSFELWLLLHLRDNPGAQHRDHLARILRQLIPGYNKHVEFARFAPGYQDAVKRARSLDRRADEDEEPGRNPTTGVWRLTESIRVDRHPPPEKNEFPTEQRSRDGRTVSGREGTLICYPERP